MIDFYYGILSLPHSWAVVATNILLQHLKKGNKIKFVSTNDYTNIHRELIPYFDKNLDKNIKQGFLKNIMFETSLSYTLPTNFRNIPAKNKYLIHNYEFNVFPNKKMIECINNHFTLFLPSSKFSASAYINSGLDPSKVFILPHGYDPELYNDSIKPAKINEVDDKFKFLCVAIGHLRKGYDVLIEAYCEEFQGDKDVCLILKEGKNNKEQVKHYDIDSLIDKMIKKYKDKIPTIARIQSYIDNMAVLYKAAHCVVLPTRGEGFCLPALEASVLGVPIIATNYSGHLDFLNENNSYLIDYKLELANDDAVYYKNNNEKVEVLWAEPNKEHLMKLMRYVKNNYDEAKRKADIAKNNVKHMTWENVYLQLIDVISKTKK